MEEKERYGITDAHYLCDSAIFNTETNDILRLYQICDLLNQQDKRIKELENMNNRLSQGIYWGNGEHFCDVVKRYKAENQQLKQSQKHFAIEQLEKVEEILWNSQDIGNVIDNDKFLEKLNYLIKSLKGEE